MNKSVKKIMVLAGGNDQIFLIEEIRLFWKEATVLLIDYLSNPPAKQFADKHIQISTLDKENVLKIAKQEGIDIVITTCTDQALTTMAYIAENMGLPSYLSYSKALECTNKKFMKEKMMQGNLPTSKFIICNCNEVEKAEIEKFLFPLIVKPLSGNSSKGVAKLNYKEELFQTVQTLGKDNNYGEEIIIEEFLEGDEYSVDAFVQDGIVNILLITKTIKMKENENRFTITQSFFDLNVHNAMKSEVQKIVQKIVEVFDLFNTPMIIQLLKKGDEIYVIEFSARTGGGNKAKLIYELVGVNILEQTIRLFAGKHTYLSANYPYKYAVINYVYANPGKFVGTSNINELKDKKIIDDYFFYKTEGVSIEKSLDSSDRVMGYLILDNNKEILNNRYKAANQSIKIFDEGNNDIVKHDIYVML